MRTTRQVAIYFLLKEKGRNFFILVKRNRERGDFWQPLTGGEEDFDGNNLVATVIRETKEELGIRVPSESIITIPYSFTFKDKAGIERTEQCFGIILPNNTKSSIQLSNEHTAIIFSDDIEYLKSLLKYEQNKIGLETFKEAIG